MRRFWLISLFLLALAANVAAADDLQGVGAVWNDFVASLRRGDYPNAHSLFSPESRETMPYPEFVAEYGPLSAAREMILAIPESQSTSMDGDWAELTYTGVNPGTGRKFRVGASLVRNGGNWGLVAARNETVERVQAGARDLLRLAWEARDRAEAEQLAAALSAAHAQNPVLRYYRIEAANEGGFLAFPVQQGLRTFYTDAWGVVKSVEQSPPPQRGVSAERLDVPARSAAMPTPLPPPEMPAPPSLENGMPEMAEPPPAGIARDMPDELAEPPPLPGRAVPTPAPRRSAEPPVLVLPDSIN